MVLRARAKEFNPNHCPTWFLYQMSYKHLGPCLNAGTILLRRAILLAEPSKALQSCESGMTDLLVLVLELLGLGVCLLLQG
jgi:hypothetical protein